MKIIYQWHRGNKPIQKAIRTLSPRYNHASTRFISDTEDFVSEAHKKSGVIETPYKEWKDKKSVKKKIVFEVTEEQYNRAREWVRKQKGKDYDSWAIISFYFPIIKQKEGKFYCSELQMITFYKMKGERVTWADRKQRVSPYNSRKAIGDYQISLLKGMVVLST